MFYDGGSLYLYRDYTGNGRATIFSRANGRARATIFSRATKTGRVTVDRPLTDHCCFVAILCPILAHFF